MARYPAIEVHAVDPDLVLAVVDDYSPTAVEEHEDGIRVFFSRAVQRDHAATGVLAAYPAAQVVALDVDDEDWAKRSQAGLRPVTVGRITVVPGPQVQESGRGTGGSSLAGRPANHKSITITIQPSMGFGTGHHATTRLCLEALQTLDLRGKTLVDLGTGSGILAIAAVCLGAASALGMDHDADAVASARENLTLNENVRDVSFMAGDLREAALPPVDVVCANLTGALLVSSAAAIKRAVRPGGVLIVSGLLAEEEADVLQALSPASVTWRGTDQEWVALAVNFTQGSGCRVPGAAFPGPD